ncbi:hypothetical protein SEA_OUTIS_47 [Gordonia phage Outis]|nr:hypothetical protein SEA_STARSTRUCK_47 [Gordonia phage StarStruck]WGH22054.1 hypothetical protein [Gordonia phage MerCougar]WKW85020.1 hypothetical protein SEA_OUTIS_47 [Gordonia phage Outis]
MVSSSTVVDFHTEVWIQFGGEAILPLDTTVEGSLHVQEEGYDFLVVAVHCVYDYGPFADPEAPPFEFEATVLRVDEIGQLLPTLSPVTCLSSPSGDGDRTTTIKE